MKKIVALGLAAALVSGLAFAGEPASNPTVTAFNGWASVKWGVDLDNDNKTGFLNEVGGDLKMKLFDGGDKSTSGEGVWAEIKIQSKNPWDPAWFEENGKEKDIATLDVDVAKIHIDNFYVGIKSGSIQVGEFKPSLALKSDVARLSNVGNGTYTQGIVAGYGDSNIGLDAEFRSNGHYTNEYGTAVKAELKDSNEWVSGLNVKGGFSYVLDDDTDMAYAGSVAYKYALDDTYYIKPMAGMTGTKVGDAKENNVVASLLFGWGDQADATPGVYFMDGWGDYNKIIPGISVVYSKDLENEDMVGDIEAAVYLGNLVENLKASAYSNIVLGKDDKAIFFAAGCAYDIKSDDVTVTPKAGVKFIDENYNGYVESKKDAPDLTKVIDEMYIKAGVDISGLINNTVFSVEYESGNLKADPVKKGTVNVGCKISI